MAALYTPGATYTFYIFIKCADYQRVVQRIGTRLYDQPQKRYTVRTQDKYRGSFLCIKFRYL